MVIGPTPTHVKWRNFSTARYMAFGEKNQFTDMITLPDWYMRLGKTPVQRQRKFRQMMDEYAIEKGYKHDPKMARGNFVGESTWVKVRRGEVREWVKNRNKKNRL